MKEVLKTEEEKGLIDYSYKLVGGTDKEEFYCDKIGKAKRVFYEKRKKYVELEDGKVVSLIQYEYVYGPKPDEVKKKVKKKLSKFEKDDEMKIRIMHSYELDLNETERANYLGIPRRTLYFWKEQYPDFFEKLECLTTEGIRLARQNIINAMKDGDVETSKWYLERKRKEEFGKTADVEVTNNILKVDLTALKDMKEEEKDLVLQNLLGKK